MKTLPLDDKGIRLMDNIERVVAGVEKAVDKLAATMEKMVDTMNEFKAFVLSHSEYHRGHDEKHKVIDARIDEHHSTLYGNDSNDGLSYQHLSLTKEFDAHQKDHEEKNKLSRDAWWVKILIGAASSIIALATIAVAAALLGLWKIH